MKWIVGIIGIVIGCANVYEKTYEKKETPTKIKIRVLIGRGKNVKITGEEIEVEGKKAKKVEVINNKILLNGKEFKKVKFPIKIMGKVLKYNGKNYRSEIEIHKDEKNNLLVINYLDLEKYVEGVVSKELRCKEIEALCAQAVAVRSFVMAKKNKNKTKLYDVESTVKDQVYEGVGYEDELIKETIKRTKGMVYTYKNQIVETRYSSTCGGRTQEGGKPYLKSIRCEYCKESPHYEWKVEMENEEVKQKLGINVRKIKIKSRKKCGRIKEIIIIDNKGNHYTLKGETVRSKLGLKSTKFKIKTKNKKLIFEGKGYGHGVGMCQYGAVGLAKKGKTWKGIIKYYYKGGRITKI